MVVCAQNTRMWLNAGAVTLGVGAAMVAGAAVASADTGTSAGHSSSGSASSSSSTPAGKAKSARTVATKPKAAAKSATSAPVRIATASRTPSATALAAVSTTSASKAQPFALATPTPNQIVRGLEQFGTNVYLTVANQINGARANVELLGDDLANVFGISRVTITNPGIYGNPTVNKQYFVPMQDYVSAALATVAMAYGQLTGSAPDLTGFTTAALNTESLVYPGNMIYRGVDANWFVKWSDSYELLQDKNVRIISRIYYGDQKTKAVNDLAAGLQDPTKAMIVALKGPVAGQTDDGTKIVTVIGLDLTQNVVTINDPTQVNGQGLEMSLDDFMGEWSSQNYQLVTAQLASSSGTPLPAPATKLEWSLPAPNDIGQALQNAGKGIAQLVVHQIEGAQANLGDLANDLGYTFGVKSPNITPPAPNDTEFGNYTANYPYWVYQGNYDTCAIMATAAIIAQLQGSGSMPAGLGQQILNQATSTPSDVYAGETIFEPNGGTDGLHWGTNRADVVKLLNMNGVNADTTTYLKSQGDVALDAMTSALGQNQGVIVSVSSNVIANAYTRKYFGQTRRPANGEVRADHAVVVISVDLSKNVVYLNDSAYQSGQGFPIPLDEFMKAWQYSNYALTTAELATT